MADANRLAAALRYQQDMEGPVTMNPNIAEQGRKGRANMAPPTSVMDPRSRDYERRSKETENFLIGADILAGALPFAPLAKGAAMAAGRYAGPELARGLENYMVKSGAVLPMDVWHGSPHRFPPTAKNPLGEFDASKIGTGEGKQQQGIGAYLAEAKQVGQKYADKEAWKRGMDDGYLYKVDIPDDTIVKMANHDAPFSQQPESVRNAVMPMIGEQEMHALKGYYGWENLDDAPFAAVMNSMEIAKGNNRAATSEALRKAGIPGIRYLDQGSRAGGAGTSNFVVFDPAHMNILERNGVTAASLRNVAPQDEALRLAQQRAAMPVEQGGLGLPAGNTPQQRADAMGFEMGWAHGSPSPNIMQMRGSTIGAEGPGAYATNYLPEASTYAKAESGATNYPLAIRNTDTLQAGSANPYDLLGAADDAQLAAKLSVAGRDSIQATQQQTPQWLLDAGAPMLPVRSHYVSQNPDNFRSRFAAFDPFRRNAALAAALGVAAPDLLAEEK